jgi:nitroimidazol reductase NimA-like FMN-containing flavoprotein (pyridoxamine 5'-phosphate oxidase superfamily)
VTDAREERLDRIFPGRAPTGWWKLAHGKGSVEKMTYRELSSDEVELVLEKERVVRISFSADGDSYVVPVFFAWHEGALCGLTTPGRKTGMGERNPVVGFQVDSTVTTGPWEWASVVGQGMFEQVPDPMESGLFAAKLWARMGDAPDWAGAMLRARFDELGVYPWRIIPATMLGRAHGRE